MRYFALLGYATLLNAQSPQVGDNEARFWADPGFSGESIVVQAGQEYDCYNRNFDDTISSIIAGKNIRVQICADPYCKNEENYGSSLADGYIESTVIGEMDDKISYIRTWPKPNDHVVTIFKDYECYFSRVDLMHPGYYNIDAISRSHVGDDELSAIDVPPNMTAILYADPNYTGTSVTIVGPARYCNGLPNNFPDNAMSSMKVYYNEPQAV